MRINPAKATTQQLKPFKVVKITITPDRLRFEKIVRESNNWKLATRQCDDLNRNHRVAGVTYVVRDIRKTGD